MATPTIISGNQATLGPREENSSRLILEIGNKIWKQGANMAALSWLADRNKETVRNQSYTVMEDADLPRTDTTNAGTLTSGATSLTMSNGDRWRPFHVWQNDRTEEKILVTAVSSNTITAVRGYGTTAAAALTDGDTWRRLGSAFAESSSSQASQQTQVSTRVNYAQFMSLAMGVTMIRQNTAEYGQKELERQRANTRRQWLIDRENSFLFGEPLLDEEGNSPVDSTSGIDSRATTGGLKYWIDTDATSNILDAGGVLSKFDLMDWVQAISKEAPKNKGNGEVDLVLLCGHKAVSVLNMFAFNEVDTKSGESMFGFNLQNIKTPFANLKIHQHHLLTGEYEDYIFAVNPDYVGTRVLQGMDISVRDVTDPKDHDIEEEIFAVHGFYLTLPELHGYAKNVELAA